MRTVSRLFNALPSAPVAIGYLAVATLVAVSATANVLFALTLGSNEFERQVFAGASLAVDAYKAFGPFFVMCMFLYRRPGWAGFFAVVPWAAIAVALWLACFAWSTASAIGFAMLSRGEAASDRASIADARGAAEAKVRRIEAQLAWVGAHRPEAVIEAEIARHDGVEAAIWTRTKRCTDVTALASEKACQPVLALRSELAAATAAARLETDLADARRDLVKVGGAAGGEVATDALSAAKDAAAKADPQAAALAALAGVAAGDVRLGLGLLLAALIEAGSGLGFTIMSLASRRTRDARDARAAQLEAATSATRAALLEASPQAGQTVALPAPPPAGQAAPLAEPPLAARTATPEAPRTLTQIAALTAPPQAAQGALQQSPPPAKHAAPPKAARASAAGASVLAVAEWARERLQKTRGGQFTASAGRADCAAWCARRGFAPPSPQAFGLGMNLALRELGGKRCESNGQVVYRGLSLMAGSQAPSLRVVGASAAS